MILSHKEWSQHANHVTNLKSHITFCKKKKKRETNRNEWSAFVKFFQILIAVSLAAEALIPHMLCVHTGRNIAWEQRPGVTRSDIGAGKCRPSSEWKMCCLTWAADGHWWIEEDKYTERHRSCGMLAIPHQVGYICCVGKREYIKRQHTNAHTSGRHLSVDSQGKTLKHTHTRIRNVCLNAFNVLLCSLLLNHLTCVVWLHQ